MPIVNNWLNIDLFRSGCALCHAPPLPEYPLCSACLEILPRNRHACRRCALPVPEGQALCGNCLQRPPAYDASLVPFIYARPVDRLITSLKFQQQLHHARLLGELLAAMLPPRVMHGLDALLPVPLHRQRLMHRGYNQSLEIARFIARRFDLPLLARDCRRTRATAVQSSLPLRQRRTNLRHAFEIHGNLRGMKIGVVDDVVTSGHTANELARTLLRAGVQSITVIAVARADFSEK